MITRACGEINARPGETIDVTEQQAKDLVSGGYAVYVDPPPIEPKPQPPKGRRNRNR